MSPKKDRLVAAQVVLRPASGKAFDGQTAITAENIAEYLPAPQTVSEAQRAFAEAGFEVSPAVGMSFSITAPASTFEKVFKVKLLPDERGGVKARTKRGEPGYELPLDALPNELKRHVVAVTFTPPPEYGPGNF
jgi:hypothetical protein